MPKTRLEEKFGLEVLRETDTEKEKAEKLGGNWDFLTGILHTRIKGMLGYLRGQISAERYHNYKRFLEENFDICELLERTLGQMEGNGQITLDYTEPGCVFVKRMRNRISSIHIRVVAAYADVLGEDKWRELARRDR